MKTRDYRSEDHNHPDQSNVTPTAPLAATFDALLLPAVQHEGRLQALRDKFAPRNFDPSKIAGANPREEQS